MRLDKWLWTVRVYKTRSLATAACRAGHVKLEGDTAKPAHELRPGQIVVCRLDDLTRTLRMISAPTSRVAGKLVPSFAEDLTPADELERARIARQLQAAAGPSHGRPTKKDRRKLEQWRSHLE